MPLTHFSFTGGMFTVKFKTTLLV
uniref:Uncharacterized protein n=1 Tax=Anguilla anguilla TaxID=7936 RepID=A0A0E9PBS7_ANGAN